MATKQFRETQWFKLGLTNEPDPADDGDEAEPSATVMMLPIEDRYADDGAISNEDSAMFSLRTGRTTQIDFKGFAVDDEPGQDVPVQALVREMKHTKGKLFAIGAGVIAACAALVIYAI